MMKKVLIVQTIVKNYRVPFFGMLSELLAADGIELRVVYGAPNTEQLLRADNVTLSDSYGKRIHNYWMFGGRVVLQPIPLEFLMADLIILEHANKLIMNNFALLLSRMRLKRVAFWGHGRDLTNLQVGVSSWMKRLTLRRVDWWFAYTEGCKKYLISMGVLPKIISNVQNAIDTTKLRKDMLDTSENMLNTQRNHLGISADTKIGLFCGALYPDKNLDFLIDAACLIQKKLPDFALIILGDGPDAAHVEQRISRISGVHWLGAKFGREKAAFFKMADVFLMPGLVGLAIVDAFASGLPLITTNSTKHGPEIEYLEPGENGLICESDIAEYAHAVTKILCNSGELLRLSSNALRSSERYNMENMVMNFRNGILGCLNS